jgi:transposase
MKEKEIPMQIVHPNAAGIDIGSKTHWVAVDQNLGNVREFGVYTRDHQHLINYLKSHQVTSVAMESTGSYWQTLFHSLQKAGFEVILVQGNQTKNVQGKKTDILDCMWIQKLHSLGLLSSSFLLSDYLQTLRTHYSHREHLVEQTAMYINKMQKALRLMNIRLDVAIRDLAGKTGRSILDAILAGHRDPNYLASLAHFRVKKSRAEIAAALHGNWREDLLFELRSCLTFYDAYKREILVCDQKIESIMTAYIPETDVLTLANKAPGKQVRKQVNRNSPSFNVRQLAFSHLKTDLFQIPGVSHSVVLCLLCNMGNDIKRFASAKRFASWLRLVPNNKLSGGRIISSKTPKGKNAIAISLRQAANSIGNQKEHPLTPFFKRIAYRKGRNAAITATARKLALIIWNMITKTQNYLQPNTQLLYDRRKLAQVNNIKSRLFRLDLSEAEMMEIFQKTSLPST